MAEYKIKDAKTADINEIFFDKNTNKMSYKNYLGIVTTIPNSDGIQSVVAGTNITVDNTDPINPIISASGGGGGLQGVHSIIKLNSGDATSNNTAASTITSTSTLAGNLATTPYIPAQTFTSSNLYISVNSAIASSVARILIYSNVNGLPNTKLYESTDLDCSTTGIKTVTTSFTFTAGVTYWLVVQNSHANNMHGFQTDSVMTARVFPASTSFIIGYRFAAAIGSAPAVWNNFASVQFSTLPAVFITVA